MFKIDSRWCVALAMLGCGFAACDDNNSKHSTEAVDGGQTDAHLASDASSSDDAGNTGDARSTDDAGSDDADVVADASSDARVDAVTTLACTGGAPLAITGTYVEANGTQHWLKRTATSVTYSRLAGGTPNNAAPPSLWSIVQVCSDQKVFVAKSETGTFSRVDWVVDSTGLSICVAVDGAENALAALSAPVPTPGSVTGCKGAAWIALAKKDGGL